MTQNYNMDRHGASRWLETASEIYGQIVFKTDSPFNKPAPAFWISFAIGGALSICGALVWLLRVNRTKKEIEARNIPFNGSTMIQTMIARAVDNDDPGYVVVSFSAFSFLFLGGLQLNYQGTYLAMIAFYGISSLGDSIRILLAVASARELGDVVQTSMLIHAKLRKVEATLKPTNVYEDLGRRKTIVVMVFITQAILVWFVGLDTYNTPTTKCQDGTSNCPVVGTLGSWGLYVLGVFMACVYLLGPKTSFGESEQNPAYWIQLLIVAKRTGAKVTWYDPVQDATKTMTLSPDDWRIWMRFVLSFIVNGVAFHILVHSLPIQIAAQSTLTGVVLRAVGMVYLVDLDDTPGYTLTIVKDTENDESKGTNSKLEDPSNTADQYFKPIIPPLPPAEVIELKEEAQRIITEAQAKLDALARGDYQDLSQSNNLTKGKLLFAGTIETEHATQVHEKQDD